MKPLRLFLCMALCTLILTETKRCQAQKHYENGYIVKHEGDTIWGRVKDRTPEPFGDLFEKIRFRKKSLFKKKYAPEDISAYGIGDRRYESHWVKNQPLIENKLFIKLTSGGKRQFMKVISKGELSHYHLEFEDEDAGGYYCYIDYIKNKKGEFLRANTGIFGLNRTQLARFLADDPMLSQRIFRGEKMDIAEIVDLYNNRFRRI